MQLAMQMMVTAADVSGATEFVKIEFAHISSSFYSGRASVDFAEFLLANRASFAVPTHTNASLIDCSSPTLRSERDHPVEVGGARRLMEIYTVLGCTPMWSCAPYAQTLGRPPQGAQIVVDTCTYFALRPNGVEGLVMTNSAKWAYYAPGILDVEVALGSLQQCVDAAVAGEVGT